VYKLLKSKGFTEEQILASNLVKKTNYGYSDVFKNRLMFPIQDIRNKYIAFGGRVLEASPAKYKYINSTEGIAYSKGKNLYAMNLAKNANMGKIIMVEGYMDTISLHQRGIPNVVASLGTALTEGQARLLRRYTEKVIISYDSDSAGQAATMRGLEILKNVGCDVRILQLEGAKDPDEYVIKYGNGRFNMLVDNAISLVEFKTKVLKKSLDLNNVNDKIKFLKETAKLLTTVESKIEQELYIDKIAKEYDISKEALYAEINKSTDKRITSKVLERKPQMLIKKEEVEKRLIEREKTIIALLLQEEVYEKIKPEIQVEDFKSEINKKILKRLYEEYEKGNSNINDILNYFIEDEQAMSRITEIMAEDYQIKNDEKTIANIINTYKIEKLDNRKVELLEKEQEQGISQEEKEKIIEEINKIIIQKKMIK
jgi:DNA primase